MSNRGSCVWKILTAAAAMGLAGLAASCVTEDSDPAGTGGEAGSGATESGGATGSGGATSSGGASGSGGTSGGSGVALECPTPTEALITDFNVSDTGTDVAFGDFTATFSGGTFVYPDTMTSDVTTGAWHVTGTVGDYTGLGLYFSAGSVNCAIFDASAFRGISFTVSGTLPEGRELRLWVGTAANEVTHTWGAEQDPPVAIEPNFGRCRPPGSNQYDGTCANSEVVVPLTDTPTHVEFLWADFTGGSPLASPDATEITRFGWFVSWGGATDTAYEMDVTIDDLSFVD